MWQMLNKNLFKWGYINSEGLRIAIYLYKTVVQAIRSEETSLSSPLNKKTSSAVVSVVFDSSNIAAACSFPGHPFSHQHSLSLPPSSVCIWSYSSKQKLEFPSWAFRIKRINGAGRLSLLVILVILMWLVKALQLYWVKTRFLWWFGCYEHEGRFILSTILLLMVPYLNIRWCVVYRQDILQLPRYMMLL